MHRLDYLLVVGCLLAACTTAEKERANYLEDAAEAREAGDWAKTLDALENAVRTDPIDLDARLRLAESYLVAFNEPEKARDLYIRTRKRSLARALHGLGRCALWEGDEVLGREYLTRSLNEKPTVACAIDLAARVPPAERERLLELPLGGRRWELFRAACGSSEPPEKPPGEPSYELSRARLASGDVRDAALRAHLKDSCADDQATRAYARVLLGETLFRRNPALLAAVKDGD
ncbi:MAG: tetratricopeptide repeat protein [Planctomycetota bacterium]|jgi:hypothetical protein